MRQKNEQGYSFPYGRFVVDRSKHCIVRTVAQLQMRSLTYFYTWVNIDPSVEKSVEDIK